ncbi:MAG: hypothetical protein KDH09_07415 [Chrysiogenetes bacterium]|nr:hypothetical protein [Chrysiogenetes bacterium]
MTAEHETSKPHEYGDRMERYAKARARNRRRACREAGKDLRESISELRRQLQHDDSEDYRQSA